MPRLQKELSTAITAVIRATKLTQKIFTSLQAGQTNSAATVTKLDKSPVTIADYGSQAIVNAVLCSVFPKDPIVGEEDAGELRSNPELREKVWKLVSSTLKELPVEELENEGGSITSDEEMMNFIDKGGSHGGSVGRNKALLLSSSHLHRFLDSRSHRRDLRISSRRAVHRMSSIDHRWSCKSWCPGVSKPTIHIQRPYFRSRCSHVRYEWG